MLKKLFIVLFLLGIFPQVLAEVVVRHYAGDARSLVQQSLDLWRGQSSYGVLHMHVHRVDEDRHLSLVSYSRGEDEALVRFIAPVRDAGNATLKTQGKIYLFTPKLQRVIQLPNSMMAQSWMGSDFSYNELAKTNQILQDYEHHFLPTLKENSLSVYQIEAIPHKDAPVVWGRVVLRIREDLVLLQQDFYDQNGQLMKRLAASDIVQHQGRPLAKRLRMTDMAAQSQWTEILQEEVAFDVDIPQWVFSQNNLRQYRPWKPQ